MGEDLSLSISGAEFESLWGHVEKDEAETDALCMRLCLYAIVLGLIYLLALWVFFGL